MALQHPNIIRLHDVHLRKSKLYLIMELATNGDLFTHIYKRGPLPPYIARNYFIQLLDAVNHCHENGIYHRDLKPENILLTQDCNVVKLADFGFAAMIDKYHPVHKLLRTNCGSPHYCAPEVWNGETYGYDGGKADAFSCGVILYVMLSGGQPFNDSSEDLVLSKVNECIVEYPERIAEDARELISGLLRRNPHTRFSTREARKHRWLDDAGTLPTTTETLDNYYVPYLQTCP